MNLPWPFAAFGRNKPLVDVFLCTVAADGERRLWYERCRDRWLSEPGVRVTPIAHDRPGARDFQRQRRIIAEAQAKSPIYVLADDDCLPPDSPFVAEALNIMERHPQYAVLSTMPSNCTINEWTPEGYQTANDWEVMEHVDVGAIRFTRKGAMKGWPPMGGSSGYDRIHCETLRSYGWRVGYFRNLPYLHLGEQAADSIWRKNGQAADHSIWRKNGQAADHEQLRAVADDAATIGH